MSNPAINLLCETKIANTTLRIEDNLGESIHIHLGMLRIDLSVKEFLNISNSIINTAGEILAETGLDFNCVDPTAFLWGWADSIMQIEKISIENIKLKELLSTYSFKKENENEPVELICGLEKTRIVEALQGNEEQLINYKQDNYNGEDNLERLYRIYKSVKAKGYPFEDKYIVINQNYQICDGDHRAGCLYYLYGPEYEIPVTMVYYKNKIRKHYTQDEINTINQSRINKKSLINKSSIQFSGKTILYEEFVEYLHNVTDDYIILSEFLMDKIYCHKADCEIIVRPDYFQKIINFLNENAERVDNTFRQYSFIYSLTIPRLFKLMDKVIVISSQLFCKSYFEDMLMPLDLEIQNTVWKTRSGHSLGKDIEIVYLITKRILSKSDFDNKDLEYIYENENLLNKIEVRIMLQKIFFGFTDELISLFFKKEYNCISSKYRKNRNY